jgi:hypothetical protein
VTAEGYRWDVPDSDEPHGEDELEVWQLDMHTGYRVAKHLAVPPCCWQWLSYAIDAEDIGCSSAKEAMTLLKVLEPVARRWWTEYLCLQLEATGYETGLR